MSVMNVDTFSPLCHPTWVASPVQASAKEEPCHLPVSGGRRHRTLAVKAGQHTYSVG